LKNRHLQSFGRLLARGETDRGVDATLAPGVTPADPTADAAWLTAGLLPLGRPQFVAGSVVRTGFDAYARIFHPAPGAGLPPRRWTWREVASICNRVVHPEMQWERINAQVAPRRAERLWRDPPSGSMPVADRAVLVRWLRTFTSTPDRCTAWLWDGFGGVAELFPDVPRAELPLREYLSLHCGVDAIASGIVRGEWFEELGPNVW
jgi:hypothetical protein